MKNVAEVPMIGGKTVQGIIRVGNTIHRPVGKNSSFTQSLLKLLEEKGFKYSPRFLGIDEKGREILTFIEGVVSHGEIQLTEENLIQCTKVLRNFHDITEGNELVGSNEVVCHNDFSPWNMVLNDGILAGIIDFDGAAPGERIDDLAYFIWTFLNLGSDLSPGIQGRKMKKICNMYGLSKRQNLIDVILKQQEKILNKRKMLSEHDSTQEARDFSKSKLIQIQEEINWVEKYRQDLQNSF